MFQAAGPEVTRSRRVLAGWAEACFSRHIGDDRFACMNSSRVPGQARSLAGVIRSSTSAIWLVTICLGRFPDDAHTVDSDKKGQVRWNAKGLRIRRIYTPFDEKTSMGRFHDRNGGRVVAEPVFAP